MAVIIIGDINNDDFIGLESDYFADLRQAIEDYKSTFDYCNDLIIGGNGSYHCMLKRKVF